MGVARKLTSIPPPNCILTIGRAIRAPDIVERNEILNAIAEKLKRQSKDDIKGRHFETWLIAQAVSWYCAYPHSYGDLEEKFQERGFEVIEKRLR